MRKVNIILSTVCMVLATFALAFGNGACIDEDFSHDTGVWTEYDPNGKIELDFTSNHRLEFNNWIRYNPGYVSRPYSTQDFVLEFDIRITASGGNAKVIGPGFSDNLATIDQVQNGIHVVYYAGFPTVSPRLSINTRVDGSTEWGPGDNPPQPNRINISKNVTYYVRLDKSGSTLTLSIFSDPARTIHISGSPKTVTTTLSGTTFNYFYAVNGYTTSPVGNWEWTTGWIDNVKACGGTVPTTPNAPSCLSATAVSSSQINLTWKDNSNNETGFKIERKLQDGNYSQIDTVGANVTSYSDTGLISGTYCYRVRAYNAAGNSGYSNEHCTTTATSSAFEKMYVMNRGNNRLGSANLDGTGGVDHGTCSGMINVPIGMAIDVNARKLYIVNAGTTGSGDDTVIRMNLDGTGCENLGNLNGTLYDPTGIALDVAAGKMYVTNSTNDTISRANLDGTGGVSLGNLNGTLDEPHGIALDLLAGKMYVANHDGWTVSRANLDGTGGENLGNLCGTVADPKGIALDVVAGKMYVLNWRTNAVSRANLDGTCCENLGNLNGTLNEPYDLALDLAACKMYVVNYDNSTVSRANLDGTGGQSLGNLNGVLNGPGGIVLGPSQPTTFQLTVTKAGTGDGTVTSDPQGINCGSDCDEAYAYDTSVTLRADPDVASVFVAWSGDCSGSEPTTTITLDENKTCIATFNCRPVVCDYDCEQTLHKPSSRNALILAPYSDTGFEGYSAALQDKLSENGWIPHYIGNDEEDVIKHLVDWLEENDYGLVHITTHGSFTVIPIATYQSKSARDIAFKKLADKYNNACTPGAVQASAGTLEGRYYIGISSEFIYHYWDGLDNRPLVYLEGCYFGSEDAAEIREAFLCKGAGAFVGFDDLIRVCYEPPPACSGFRTARDVSEDFYNHVFGGYTVQQAADRRNTPPGHHGDCWLPIPCEKVYLQSYGNPENLILENYTIAALDDLAASFNLPHGIESSLLSKLEGALTSLEKGNAKAAINKLNAFINEVEAQRGKKITEREADQLIDGANWIIESIDGVPVTPTQARTSIAIEVFPNPVRDVNTATFRVMGEAADLVEVIKVQIFDLGGRLVYESEKAGISLDWHTTNRAGEYLANGIYLYKIYALIDGRWVESEIKKLAILR